MNLDLKTKVALKLIYLSAFLHALGLLGLIGGSTTRHIAGIIIPVALNIWMMMGYSKIPWILNIVNTASSALLLVVYGLSVFPESMIKGTIAVIYAILYANLCRQLCAGEISSQYI